jgi:hypothetical protein
MQSLMLLNDPLVVQQARIWSESIAIQEPDPIRRIEVMHLSLLGHPMTSAQQKSAIELMQQLRANVSEQEAWAAFAHAMLNLKEAWYIK